MDHTSTGAAPVKTGKADRRADLPFLVITLTLLGVGRQLAVVFHRLQGVGVPVQTDMAHLGGGNEGENAVHHAQSGPQDGDNGQLFSPGRPSSPRRACA